MKTNHKRGYTEDRRRKEATAKTNQKMCGPTNHTHVNGDKELRRQTRKKKKGLNRRDRRIAKLAVEMGVEPLEPQKVSFGDWPRNWKHQNRPRVRKTR